MRDYGPQQQGILLTLLMLGTFMDERGVAYPSQKTLARAARGCVRTVKSHVKQAKALGWLEVELAGRNGKGWRHYAYRCTVPDAVAISVDERGATIVAPPSPSAPQRGATANAPPTPQGGAILSEGGASPSTEVVQQLVPTNSYSETPALRTKSKSAASRPRDTRSAAQEPQARESFDARFERRFGCKPPVHGGSAARSASEPDASPRATTTADLKSAVEELASKMRVMP